MMFEQGTRNSLSIPSLSNFIGPDRIVDDNDYYGSSKANRLKKVNQFLFCKKVGRGTFSKVYMAVNIKSGEKYAAKAIHINSRANGALTLEREVRNLRRLNGCNTNNTNNNNNNNSLFNTNMNNGNSNENIIKLHEVLHCKRAETVYLLMEWAPCGSLQNLIDQLNSEKVYPINFEKDEYENNIAVMFHQIIKGVKYLHSQGIVHHDIKPSNILLFENEAKLADFGIGHSFQSTDSVVGTPAYQAPEFFSFSQKSKKISESSKLNCQDVSISNSNLVIDLSSSDVRSNSNDNDDSTDSDDNDDSDLIEINPALEDVWSLGVTLFYLVFGKLPYIGENMYEIARLIYSSPLNISSVGISTNLYDILKRMLTVDPAKRITVDELLAHPFFENNSGRFHFPELAEMKRKFNDVDELTDSAELASFLKANETNILEMKAEVCGKNYCFACAKRSLSWQGVERDHIY